MNIDSILHTNYIKEKIHLQIIAEEGIDKFDFDMIEHLNVKNLLN